MRGAGLLRGRRSATADSACRAGRSSSAPPSMLSVVNGSTGAILDRRPLARRLRLQWRRHTPASTANSAAWVQSSSSPAPSGAAVDRPTPCDRRRSTGNGHSTGSSRAAESSRPGTTRAWPTPPTSGPAPRPTSPPGRRRPAPRPGDRRTRLYDVTLGGVRTLTGTTSRAAPWRGQDGRRHLARRRRPTAELLDAAVAGTERRGADPIVVGGRVYAGYSPTRPVPPGSNPPLTALGV